MVGRTLTPDDVTEAKRPYDVVFATLFFETMTSRIKIPSRVLGTQRPNFVSSRHPHERRKPSMSTMMNRNSTASLSLSFSLFLSLPLYLSLSPYLYAAAAAPRVPRLSVLQCDLIVFLFSFRVRSGRRTRIPNSCCRPGCWTRRIFFGEALHVIACESFPSLLLPDSFAAWH